MRLFVSIARATVGLVGLAKWHLRPSTCARHSPIFRPTVHLWGRCSKRISGIYGDVPCGHGLHFSVEEERLKLREAWWHQHGIAWQLYWLVVGEQDDGG